MRVKLPTTLLIAGLALLAGTAHGATLRLAPANSSVIVGNTLTLSVFGEFGTQGTLGGGFDVFFDDSLLDFVSFEFDAGLMDEVEPLYGPDGEVHEEDDGLRRDSATEKLAKLRPVFDREVGLVTAGNSSQVTDGAALLLMAGWLRGRMRARLLGVLLLGILVVGPALAVPEVADRINRRFASFENLEEDKSLNARLGLYRKATLLALTNPVGVGIGSTGTARKIAEGNAQAWDSGLLLLTYQMGWPGLLLFLSSLALLALFLWRVPRRTPDPFVAICAAIAFAVLALMVFKSALTGASGAVFWCFAGLAVAGLRYHRAQDEAARAEAAPPSLNPASP